MDSLISFLLLVAVFYFMMRVGRGGHGVQRRDGEVLPNEFRNARCERDAGAEAVDPICGMKVAPGSGYAKVVGGYVHRFCSRACLDRFKADLEKHEAWSEEVASPLRIRRFVRSGR